MGYDNSNVACSCATDITKRFCCCQCVYENNCECVCVRDSVIMFHVMYHWVSISLTHIHNEAHAEEKIYFSFSSFSISIQCSVSRWVYNRSHVSSCWLTWCSIVFLGHVFHEKSVQVVILEIWIFWHWSDDPSYFCVHVYLLIYSRTQGLIIGTSVSWKECADIKSNYTFVERRTMYLKQ